VLGFTHEFWKEYFLYDTCKSVAYDAYNLTAEMFPATAGDKLVALRGMLQGCDETNPALTSKRQICTKL